MQTNITTQAQRLLTTETIDSFFKAYLSRKPTQEELANLYDEYSADFDPVFNRAMEIGLTYSKVLTSALIDRYHAEIQVETEVYRLQLQFQNAVALLTSAMDRFQEAADTIVKSDHCGKVMDAISDTDVKVTLLEPALLKVQLEEALKSCHDAYLKDLVYRKDPTLVALAYDGEPWFDRIKADGRVTVGSIKRVRDLFNPALGDIKDGRRIVELVLEGKIK